MEIKKAAVCVKKHKSFLITAHTNLEGDALGSELAFYMLARKMGKAAMIVNEDDLPYGYDFLPETGVIKKLKNNLKKNLNYDCFVVLDCSDLKRTGEVYRLNTKKPVLNIDHHISNTRFGDVNWVEPDASSCCELIYKLYKELRVPLDKDSALALYAGILTDTGSFRYSNTTAMTHEITTELLRYGISAQEVYNHVYENVPYSDMRILARILTGMNREYGGKVVWFHIGKNLLKKNKFSFDLSDEILNFGRTIKDVEVVVLFKESSPVKNEIRVSFRSHGKVNVNEIARFFGGGGHKTAAGATICGDIGRIRKKVLAKIKTSL